MGYLFIIAACLIGTVKAYSGKQMSNFAVTVYDDSRVSALRIFFCVITGGVILTINGSLSHISISGELLLISLLCGVAYAINIITWLIAVKSGVLVLMDIFGMLSTAVPLSLSYVLYNEIIKPIQFLGLAVLMFAAYLMCSYSSKTKAKLSFTKILLLLFFSLSNGTVSFCQKLFSKEIVGHSISEFNFYTYIFSLIFILIYMLILKLNSHKNGAEKIKPKKITPKILIFIIIMAVGLFFFSYCLTIATHYLNSVYVFPAQNGLSLLLSLAMGAIIFKEKINRRCIIGIIVTFIALILINVIPAL